MNSPQGAFDFSLIPDAYFIFDIISAHGETSQTAMLQTLNRLKTLDLNSEYQAEALGAFQLQVPRFFHTPKEFGGYCSGTGESHIYKRDYGISQ